MLKNYAAGQTKGLGGPDLARGPYFEVDRGFPIILNGIQGCLLIKFNLYVIMYLYHSLRKRLRGVKIYP
jgi:hypothetical protein